jgi:hypothetical protein
MGDWELWPVGVHEERARNRFSLHHRNNSFYHAGPAVTIVAAWCHPFSSSSIPSKLFNAAHMSVVIVVVSIEVFIIVIIRDRIINDEIRDPTELSMRQPC